MSNTKKKKVNIQKIFCALSLVLILILVIICIFKVFKGYTKYNKELIADTISFNKTAKKDGKTYIFKGRNSENYILVSNMLFRIIKTNIDGSVDVVLAEDVNALEYNSSTNYIESDIHKYLNDVFLSKIDKDYLTKTVICTDLVSDLNKYTCSNKNTDYYVRLLDVADYLNSFDEDTYISSGEIIWLSTMKDKEYTWVASSNKVAYLSNVSNASVRPVITLENSLIIRDGKGTMDEPYIISNENKVGVGSYVKIGEDIWIVYDKTKDNVKLVLYNNINNGVTKFKFNSESIKFDVKDENSLAYYLNNTYYESLPYKDLLKEFEVCTGTYAGKYSDVCSTKEKVKVGIPSVVDFKFKGNNYEYYLANGTAEEVYYYDAGLYLSKPNLIKPIRPAISIKTPSTKKGKGTYQDPYVVEVK